MSVSKHRGLKTVQYILSGFDTAKHSHMWPGHWRQPYQSGTPAHSSCHLWWASTRNCTHNKTLSPETHGQNSDTNDQFTPIQFVCDVKHGWYYGHKNKRSYISPPLSEMTILSEVMKDAWEQSSVIFTSSCDPEEQKRLNGNIKVNKNHLLVIINLTVRTVFLGKESQQNLRKGKAVVPLVWLLSDTPNGGTLWFR